ncbi:hypothetical protein L9F63_001726 [Diploptera punctata]|uniref:Uncharacterized protein n=1 Tax=Diploptera punctata TaxID=6984 RepID=A0AAD8EIG5_DIPPU|nr:hypothetical protein L9F63_001726 [Diploptera punctata]
MRENVIKKIHEFSELKTKLLSEKKIELNRLAVKEQIALDTEHRKKIQDIIENEKKEAMKELEKWKISQLSKVKEGSDILRRELTSTSRVYNINPTKQININIEAGMIPMPLPRSKGTIQINFTPRDFPTPKRESQEQEEEEWLKKQAEARRKIGFVAEDLRPDELDPLWLKEKGDSFFKAGNYLAAISAFSHGIKLGSKMPALYSNRAAAQFAIGNLKKCVEDCSIALDLFTPKISANALSRARCHARRGTALCKMGLYHQGIGELRAAVDLQPDNDKLRMDLEKARAMVDASFTADDLD